MKYVWASVLLLSLAAAAACGPQKKFCLPKMNGGTGDQFGNCPVPVDDGGAGGFIGDDGGGPSESRFIGGDN
jgi:hypothetical protein